MITIDFDQEWEQEFLHRLSNDGPWGKWEVAKLAMEAEEELAIPSFFGLQAPKHLPNLKILPHQLETAKQVVENMNGKAILADEVGLGKTIEAGLILKEYMIRGLVKKVLILVPASLVLQWVKELNEKFYIPAVAQKKAYVWEQYDVVISSLDTAKRNPHRDIIFQQNWDFIIVDEAHKLKNKKTKNYEFVQQLKKRFCLLLTATPIQNKIEEIFNLVSLLKPGHLGNIDQFQNEFASNKRSIENEEKLKKLIHKVMIRNRREKTNLSWTSRHVKNIAIDFSEAEKMVYDKITAAKHEQMYSEHQLSTLTLLREICSSREALFMTLKKMIEKEDTSESTKQFAIELISDIEKINGHSKAEKLLEIIKEIDGKVIVFTEYRATQLYLQWFLQQNGISSVPFRGGFKRSKKDWMTQLFKDHAQVLIATEAGGEGINLQFCQHVINYDLPWNPMRIEQRIGRVHRIGQEKDVHIYNFTIKDTIEEHILSLLYEKIQLFESTIGQLDDILAKLDLKNIEQYVNDIFLHSESKGEIKIKMDNLSELINFQRNLKEEDKQQDAAT
ncbi:ATP-dependent helicase [Pueribacillus theae]|uniref:ATP-dependent helicase n=1 Tax=Pueribacillus theae TaxID=2171751 RepID=A0A2U1K7U8_9BACI|nr:SNF2-related protein [Pueribacillus theae]PWA13345.1 ATP-dependent helicase [Pueribacillus theae]